MKREKEVYNALLCKAIAYYIIFSALFGQIGISTFITVGLQVAKTSQGLSLSLS
jgi:hypothetical protein